jgi:lipoprotein-anchoring transpeptidase ErfK/SrfK
VRVGVRSRWAAALAILGVTVSACSAAGNGRGHTVDQTARAAPRAASATPDPRVPTPSPSASTTHTSAPSRPVHMSLFEGDGQTYGVGFAIIATFDRAPTDSHAFTDAATVTVNGAPAHGAWFWQKSEIPGYALEAIYRPRQYWPAHAAIHADLPMKDLSAGKGLTYDDSLTLSVRTGARHVSVVDNVTHRMTVTSDGKVVQTMPVSLGSGNYPTYRGDKVIMAKGEDAADGSPRPLGEVRMVSNQPGDQYNLLVPWSVRVTNSGEYVHSASWNTGNIGSRNTSHGCTNLDVAAAEWFYHFSLVGDVVEYPNASGPIQPSWDGWGWWNLPWSTWSQGGLLLTH